LVVCAARVPVMLPLPVITALGLPPAPTFASPHTVAELPWM
jgi:hypothetical protein